MDLAGAGGGGPAPFLLKTYDMIDDRSTNAIVSWSATNSSFIVWDPPEFARSLLPTYFKHNNFSSFIRQLNTYGFRKIDSEKWEFANEEFLKDQKHLLKNIHRRKPIHSHSNPQGSVIDPERTAFEEEIEGLTREKAEYEANIFKFQEEQSAAKFNLDTLTQRVGGLEQRQHDLFAFIERAIQNPKFVEQLGKKIDSMDVSAYSKKRRVPHTEPSLPVLGHSFTDNHSSSRPPDGLMFHQDFSNKLNLELSPCASDVHLVSCSTQSSNEDGVSSQKMMSDGATMDPQIRKEGTLLELADTCTSFTFNMNSSLRQSIGTNVSPCPNPADEVDGLSSCHLNLSLASSPLQINRTQLPAKTLGVTSEAKSSANEKEIPELHTNQTSSSRKEVEARSQAPSTAPQAPANDAFWEQYLTERPGCSDNEEASSNFRSNLYDTSEDKQPRQVPITKGTNQLSL